MTQNSAPGQGFGQEFPQLDHISNFSEKIKAAFELDDRMPHVRGKYKGKYDCPCCGEPSVTFGSKGFSCWKGCSGSDIVKQIFINIGYQSSKRKRQAPVRIQKQSYEKVLTVNQWHNSITGLRKLLKLNEQDRQYLREKGLSDRGIDNGLYFSIPAGFTDVTGYVHKDFPGTHWAKDSDGFNRQYLRGRSTKNEKGEWERFDTIAIPAFGPLGKITGLQTRAVGEVEPGDRYRFLWGKDCASGNKVIWNKEKEPSITYWSRTKDGLENQKTGDLYLVEGILKPGIASDRHQVSVMGAPSANFASSPEQLYYNLIFATLVNEVTRIIFAVDEGTYPSKFKPEGNPNIVRNWIETYLAIRRQFPDLKILVRISRGCDFDEDPNIEAAVMPFEDWLKTAALKSKKIKKMVAGLKRKDFRYRPLASLIQQVEKYVKLELVEKHSQALHKRWQWKEHKKTAIVLYQDYTDWREQDTVHPHCDMIPESVKFKDERDGLELDGLDIKALYEHVKWHNKNHPSDRKPYPTIIFASQDEREEALEMLIESGFTKGHDLTGTGLGKSFSIVNSSQDLAKRLLGSGASSDINRLYYMIASPLNPTVDLDMSIMPSRRDNLYVGWKDRLYNKPGKGRLPLRGTGNCGRAPAISEGINKGMTPTEIHSIYCSTCWAFAKCKTSTGIIRAGSIPGLEADFPYGFLADRKAAIEDDGPIALHPSQAPSRSMDENQRGIGPADLVVLDDIRLTTQKTVSVTLTSVNEAIASLASNVFNARQVGNSDLKQIEALEEILMPELVALKEVLQDQQLLKDNKHGLRPNQLHQHIIKKLRLIHPDTAISRIEVELADLGVDWWNDRVDRLVKNKISDLFHNVEALRNGLSAAINPAEALQVTQQEGRQHWVYEYLKSFKDQAIATSLVPGRPASLNIQFAERSQVNRVKTGGFLLTLDATLDTALFARDLRVSESEVARICQQPPKLDNLDIFNLTDCGKLTNQRWGGQQVRRIEAIAAYENSQREVGLITHQRQVKSNVITGISPDRQGYWGNDNRGSNKYQHLDSLILAGMPIPNMNSSAAQLQVELKDWVDPNGVNQRLFLNLQNQKVLAEIAQGIGRLRASRTDDRKRVILIGMQVSEDFLKAQFPGATIKSMTMASYCTGAKDKRTSALHDIGEAVKASFNAGVKPIQAAIADKVGVTDRTIRNRLRDFGGFKQFVRNIQQMISMSSWQQVSQVPNKLRELAATVMPELFAEWDRVMDQQAKAASEGSYWMQQQLEEVAHEMAIASMKVLSPIVKLPAKELSQLVGSFSPDDRVKFWQVIMSLEPTNFDRLLLACGIEMLE